MKNRIVPETLKLYQGKIGKVRDGKNSGNRIFRIK